MKFLAIPLIALQLLGPLSILIIFTAYQKIAVLILPLITVSVSSIIYYFICYKRKDRVTSEYSYLRDWDELHQRKEVDPVGICIGALSR